MGDPRKLKNKYERPKKLWDELRLGVEKKYKQEYALKNMRELWVAVQELKKYRREARRLLSLTEDERKDDAVKILTKLNKFGILNKDSNLDEVLSLTVKNILERRLQTIVYRKGLARSMQQSRQLITHGFISVNSRRVSSPSYLMNVTDEATVAYAKQIDLNQKEPVAKPEAVKPAEAAAPSS